MLRVNGIRNTRWRRLQVRELVDERFEKLRQKLCCITDKLLKR